MINIIANPKLTKIVLTKNHLEYYAIENPLLTTILSFYVISSF